LLDIGNGLINEVPISDDYLVQGGSSVLIDKIYDRYSFIRETLTQLEHVIPDQEIPDV
jgi:flavorubredoxin